MSTRTDSSPVASWRALEARLPPGPTLARRRQLLVAERFLARLEGRLGEAPLLAGPVALAWRLHATRAPRSLELRVTRAPDALLERLQQAGRVRLGDGLVFEVTAAAGRFEVQGRLAGERLGECFGLEVVAGAPVVGEPGLHVGEAALSELGVAPARVRLLPVETQVAETFHAYTAPRGGVGLRVEDLAELALLATTGRVEARVLREALVATFAHRGTHAVPTAVKAPPEAWRAAYEGLAREEGWAWKGLEEVTEAVRRFLGPVVGGEEAVEWDPAAWAWG